MVWVYRHTRSLPVGIVMHASLTSSMLILGRRSRDARC